MDRTLPWKPNAWTFALRWQSKAKQTFQIGPHYGLHIHLVLGHQQEQGDIVSKDQGKSPFSLRNAKRMNQKLCNLCILGISRVLSLKLCNLAPINHM